MTNLVGGRLNDGISIPLPNSVNAYFYTCLGACMRMFEIKEPIYNSETIVFVGVKKKKSKEVDEFIKKYSEGKSITDISESTESIWRTATVAYVQTISIKKNIMVFYDKNPKADLIAHECLHVSSAVLLGHGIELTKTDHDEPYAYFIQFLVKAILDNLKKAKSK